MIDLDNQLAAYARYLDDTERSVVFLQPERLPLHSRVSRSHRRIALAAACVIALGGAIAIGTTRFGGRDGVSGTVTPPGEWALVDDPDGVFVPPPGGASVGDEQHGAISENAIWVHSVEPIGDGFLAVGDEMHGFAPVGAVWRSADGESWERLAHDDSFGALGISENPTASGPSMADVAARDGRVVIAGSLTLGRDPAVWWSDDLNEWHMIEVGATGQTQPAIAASERGFAMVEIAYGSTGTRDSAAGWFSTDGLTWVPATFEDGAGSRVGMSSQRKTDGSLPDRWEPLLRSGPLATDSNGDGPMSSRPRALRFDSRRFSLSSHSTGTLSATEVPTVRATLGSRVSAAGSRRRGPLNRPYGSRATAGDGPRSARLPIASTR